LLCGLSSPPLDQYVEMYSYHAAGGVIGKRIQLQRYLTYYGGYAYPGPTANWEVDYTYNSAGQVATTTYPMAGSFCASGPCSLSSPAVTLTYGFDSMGRPNSLTDSTGNSGYPWNYSGSSSVGPINWVQNVSYDYAGRLSSLQYVNSPSCCSSGAAWTQQTMSYNTNGQLTSLGWATNPYGSGFGTPSGLTYTFSSTQNNGQITQMADALSGETVSYAYDALKRLSSASSTASWSQSYTYDGFGNLTAKGGSAPQTLSVNASTNRLSSAYYDANGNMTSGFGATLTYDEANRVASAAETSGGIEYYIYGADNKRIYRMASSGTEYWTFYGAFGEKLGVYTFSYSAFVPYTSNIYFAGKIILESGYPAYMDRTGTNKGVPNGYGSVTSYTHYYPFGEEISGATTNDHEKFATYTRDSYTGLDYADQRYYTSTFGRYNSPDPYSASGGPASPGSWNRYAYTRGDPINRLDPHGTCDVGGVGYGESIYDGSTIIDDYCLDYPPPDSSYDYCAENPFDPTCYYNLDNVGYYNDGGLPNTAGDPPPDDPLQDCINAVQSGANASIAAFQTKLGAAQTLNEVVAEIVAVGTAAEVGYQTAAVGIAVTYLSLPEVATAAITGAIATYAVIHLGGIAEGRVVAAVIRLADSTYSATVNYLANSQAQGCIRKYGPY
jgi:RHS repeat-associated protein